MKSLATSCLLALAAAAGLAPSARAYTHPGIPLSVSDLDTLKANLTVEPWKSGYAALAADSHSQLAYVMQGPFATVSRTGIVGGGDDPGAAEYNNDMQAVHNLARMWYFTGDTAYAQKARDILLAWAAAHTGWGGAEPYLTMGDNAYRIFGGASILRGTWPGWTQADTDTCKTYFTAVYWNTGLCAVPNPVRSANQGTFQLAAALGVAVFCDDEAKFAQCLQSFRADPCGGLANTLPNGQVGDSGRDQGHAFGQILNLAWMAEVFWKQGVDVYAELDNRLLAVGEYYARYNSGAATPYVPFGTKYDYYWQGHGGLPQSSVKPPDMLNLLLSAYVTRKGQSAPWMTLYRANRPEGADSFVYRKAGDTSAATRPAPLASPAPAAPAVTGDLTPADIGTAAPAGTATYADGTWTLTGGGANIWGATDSYHCAYKQVTGDFTLIANVTSLQLTSPNAKAGLVLCDSLAANSARRVYLGYTPGTTAPLVETHLRGYTANSHNVDSESTHDGPANMLPQWLKLQRIGSRVSLFHCNDGANWVPLQHAEYAGWTDTAYVGLAVCSFVNGTPATATFANVALTGGTGTETIATPSAPLALFASPGNRQVPLRWLPCAGATAYHVKRSASPGGPYSAVATVVGTHYTDNALANGTPCYYVVSAANAAGESAPSPEETVTPLPPLIRIEAEAYASQAGVQLENSAEGGQNLSFIGNNDWTQYDNLDFGAGATTLQARVANPSAANAAIEVRLDGATGPLVGTIPVPVTGGWQTWTTSAITLSGVTGVHHVHLKFITGGFNLNWFEYQRLDAPAPVAATAAPAGLTATAASTTQINLAWTASPGASGYRVKRAATVIAENLPATTLADTGLLPATAYGYTVTALNAGGESSPGAQASATTLYLPAPWEARDIGAVGLAGTADYAGGTFTVKGSGADIQSTADAFHFVWQPLTGDGTVIARVAALASGDQWAKAGVMLRETLAPGSVNTCMVVSRSNGVSWQRRTATGGTTTATTTAAIAAPHWVKLQRVGNTFTASTSADGVTWTVRGSQSIAMAGTVCAGLAVCARNNTQLNTSAFDNVTVSGPVPPATPASLTATAVSTDRIDLAWAPSAAATAYHLKRATTSGGPYATVATGLTAATYGDTGLAPSTAYYYVVSAGNAFGDSPDSAQASATTQTPPPAAPANLSATGGNAQITLAWTAAAGATGYNLKRATTVGGPYATVASGLATTGHTDTGLANGTAYYYVVTAVNAGGESPASAQASATPQVPPPAAPTGLAATAGNAQVSLAWTAVSGAGSYTLKRSTTPGGPYAIVAENLATTAHTDTGLANGTTYYYVVTAVNPGGESSASAERSATPLAPALPSPWATLDIGAVGAAGSATHNAGTFTLDGSGADIWSTADEFRYVHQPATGDCSITVQVLSVENTDPEAKAGIMIRETTAANSRYAGVFITPGAGVRFQRRTSTGNTTAVNTAAGVTAPRWIRLTRTGNSYSAYYSANGTVWTQINGAKNFTMAASATLGLAVSSRADGTLCTATLGNVTVVP